MGDSIYSKLRPKTLGARFVSLELQFAAWWPNLEHHGHAAAIPQPYSGLTLLTGAVYTHPFHPRAHSSVHTAKEWLLDPLQTLFKANRSLVWLGKGERKRPRGSLRFPTLCKMLGAGFIFPTLAPHHRSQLRGEFFPTPDYAIIQGPGPTWSVSTVPESLTSRNSD